MFVSTPVILFLILFVLHLLSRYEKDAPAYSVFRGCSFSFYEFGRQPELTLSHKKGTSEDIVVASAISYAFKMRPMLDCLSIRTTAPFSYFSIPLEHLHSFRYLKELNLGEYQLHDTGYFPVTGLFEKLTIPKVVTKLCFAEDCSILHCLVMPSTKYVPAYMFELSHILVPPDFKIIVPSSLVEVYKSSPEWQRMVFISTSDSSSISPSFVGSDYL